MTLIELVKKARRVRQCAHAPYSRFKVGAALEAQKRRVFCGCNVESASYGLTVCAERVAIWRALADGETKFRRLVVVADTEDLTPPCGACRQIIWEFCGDIEVVLANLRGDIVRHKMRSLLPEPFDRRFLEK